MQYSINQLRQHIYGRVYEVYEVFKNFFGEEYVDLQIPYCNTNYILHNLNVISLHSIEENSDKCYEIPESKIKVIDEKCALHKATILVWWPNVVVSNENNKSISIQDLYAKVGVQLDGRIPYENTGFLLNRATYSEAQFVSNYLHSHIRQIPKCNFSIFEPPCLGHGPVRDTIATLKNEYSNITWMLFCQELSMYVSVESINGGPWQRLENVSLKKSRRCYKGFDFKSSDSYAFLQTFSEDTFKSFIKYYLTEGHLSLGYRHGNFVCGMSYCDFIIDISNCFIDFFNTHLSSPLNVSRCFSNGLLNKVYLDNGKFYYESDMSGNPVDVTKYNDKYVCTFKGKSICTKIIKDVSTSKSTAITVLFNGVAMCVLEQILQIINYKYKNEHFNKQGATEDSASSQQRTLYI